jgi:hypothetical protein
VNWRWRVALPSAAAGKYSVGEADSNNCDRDRSQHSSGHVISHVGTMAGNDRPKRLRSDQCASATSPAICSRLTSMRKLTATMAPINEQPASSSSPAVKFPVRSFR